MLFISTAISIVSILIASFLLFEHYRLKQSFDRPELDVYLQKWNKNEDAAGIYVLNCGRGPAVITEFSFYIDNGNTKDIMKAEELLEALNVNNSNVELYDIAKGTTIFPYNKKWFLKVCLDKNDQDLNIDIEKLGFYIQYKSINNICYRFRQLPGEYPEIKRVK